MNENEIAKIIVDKCFKIHNKLGPGLLESVYEKILLYELKKSNLKCKSQVEDLIIIELKSIENVLPVHKKQLLTYLKITGIKLGLLINFNEKLIKDGITRIVNKL